MIVITLPLKAMSTIYIAYGSETGNAQRLATTLAQRLEQQHSEQHLAVQLGELNDVALADLSPQDTLLIITSSFGDGEPTGNAEAFYERLLSATSVDCQFAVFGLGDVSYPKFCGFSAAVDERLRDGGATALARRVDADTHFQAFFDTWSAAVLSHFAGDSQPLQALNLQVKAYSEDQSFTAKIASVQRINSGDFPVYDVDIDIAGSGMNYQAGDLLYLLPPPNPSALSRIAAFYGGLNDAQHQALAQKELRQTGKPLLRALAKKTGNQALKNLTKMRAAAELADYLYGRDVADVLNDFCTPESVSVDDLLTILSAQLPRAYSIASCGEVSPTRVRLCVREVNYVLNGKHYFGSGSHFLSSSAVGTEVAVYVRANPHFHLPTDDAVPMIMIGAGTGIAPYLGFLAKQRGGEAHLFFGERHSEHDFLYRDELQQQLDSGNLTALHTAFSRDQAEKIYVQDILRQQGQQVWRLLQDNGEIYLCGSKTNLGSAIDKVLYEIAEQHGGLSELAAKEWLFELVSQDRFHKDLY